MKKLALSVLLLFLCLSPARPQGTAAPTAAVIQPAPAPGYALEPASSGGLIALDRLLQKLGVHKRMLVVGAHPDDEDNRLLTVVSREMGAEVAYLSLSRGEGGQNLLGPDLGVPLGLVRTQELLGARRIDGARQFFTRAYDFGYTRSLDETWRLWPKAMLLEDALRVARRFRPQIVVSLFSGTPNDGHGQHQASGIIGEAIYDTLAGEGPPGKPTTFFRSYVEDTAATFDVPTGDVDPLTGRSYHQIAAASRSLHRSQDMGALQPPGPNKTEVTWVKGGEGPQAKQIFAGVDTRLTAIAAGVGDSARRARVEERLRKGTTLVESTRAKLGPAGLPAAVAPIGTILSELSAARKEIDLGDKESAGAHQFLDEKISLAETAFATAAEITVDALADRETTAPGDPFEVKVTVWNAGTQPVSVESVELRSPDGWEIPDAPQEHRDVAPGTLSEWTRKAAPKGAVPTLPYFLRRPLAGALYDWTDVPATIQGEPFQPAALRVFVRLRVAETPLYLWRDVVWRFRDQAQGEVRRPVRAVPVLEVSVDPDRIVWPTAQKGERRLEVTLTSNVPGTQSGRVETTAPPGWPAITPVEFSTNGRGDRRFFEIPIRPPTPFAAGRGTLRVTAIAGDGTKSSSSVRVLDYPHIPPTPMADEASVDLVAADIRLPPVKRVGYVRGASDRVPEALTAIGVPLEVLDAKSLQSGDLSRFDAIVVGSRAYETDPALARANGRLLDYARAGGLVIVQYQQYQFVDGKYAPYKIEIARPHDRVTDETAPVKVLQPESPVFRTPNPITDADWAGWVQERGLYFAHTWDPAYTPLLAMKDPGQPEQQGSLLVAPVGKGLYVYTGLAFFRQLPNGVPGAYRLFANLLGLKAASRAPAARTSSR
jgi:LmbE family N-acetylglucosaminyl deacetylase